MAAPSTGRRRPAGRRGGLLGSPKRARNGCDGRIRLLRFLFIVFLVLVGGKAVALASSSQHLTQLAQQQQTAGGRAPGPPRLHPRQERRRTGRRQAAADRVSRPVPAAGSRSGGGRALRRAADQPPARSPGRGEDAAGRREAEQLVRLRGAQGRPRARQGRARARPARRGQLRRGEADLPAQGHGGPGRRLRRHGEHRALRHRTAVRGGTLRQGRQRDRRARPRRTPLKTVAQVAPQPGQNVYLTLDREIQYYAEDVLEETVRRTAAKAATAIVMDPRTGESPRHGQRHPPGVPRLRQGRPRRREEPRRRGRLRARLHLQAGDHLRRAGRRHREAEHEVHAARRASRSPTARSTNRTRAAPSPTRCARSCSGRATSAPSRSARTMGEEGLYKWVKAFGFGKPTGIEFPGEVRAASSARSRSGRTPPSATSPWARASP